MITKFGVTVGGGVEVGGVVGIAVAVGDGGVAVGDAVAVGFSWFEPLFGANMVKAPTTKTTAITPTITPNKILRELRDLVLADAGGGGGGGYEAIRGVITAATLIFFPQIGQNDALKEFSAPQKGHSCLFTSDILCFTHQPNRMSSSAPHTFKLFGQKGSEHRLDST